jgi:hypothetical protein
MAGERSSVLSFVSIAVLIVSGAFVLTAFGWYAALNALIPFLIGLVWLAVFATACWGAGDLVCRRWFRPDTAWLERVVMQLLVGTAVVAAAAGVLALAHLLKPVPLLMILGGFGCHGALRIYRSGSDLSIDMRAPSSWWWLVVGIAGGLSLAAATTFAPFYDQWHYHLGFPYQWLRAGTPVTFARQAYSYFPSNMGLLYLYGLAGPGPWAAQVVHWWMGALTAGGAAIVARRLGAPSGGQVLAAAMFAATPSVVQVGALAASDLGVAAFATGSVIALLRMKSDSRRTAFWAAVSGGFAGLAAGTKYLALASVVVPTSIAVAFIAIAAAPRGSSRLRLSLRALVPFVVVLLVVAAPWYARNALQTGNPVHPYFASIMGQSEGDTSTADDRVASGIGSFTFDRGTVTNALFLGTFDRRGHAGDIGPVHLWLTPLVLLWMWRHRENGDALVVFGVLILGLGVWAVGPPLGRYLLPTLALTSAVAATSWSEIVGRLGRPTRHLLSAFLFVLLAANCNPVRGEYLGPQLAAFLGFQTDEQYLQDNCTQLPAFRAANTGLPTDARVLLLGEPRAYGLDRDLVVEDQFRTPLLVELAESAGSAVEIRQQLEGMGITHVLWNGAEAERIADAEGRTEYLACSSPDARARLERFLADEIQSVADGPWWKIGVLAPR